jgi:hypothetical protein
VRAYVDATEDVTGWVGFDVSMIPPTATVLTIELELHHEVGFDNPKSSPLVVVAYSKAKRWTRASATANALPRSEVLPGKIASFQVGAWNDFVVQATRDWSFDFAQGWLTLGVTNVNPSYSYVYFNGSDLASQRPKLRIQTCE